MQRHQSRKEPPTHDGSSEDGSEEPFIVQKANIQRSNPIRAHPINQGSSVHFAAPKEALVQAATHWASVNEEMQGPQEMTDFCYGNDRNPSNNLYFASASSVQSEESQSEGEEDEAVQELEARLMRQGLAFQKKPFNNSEQDDLFTVNASAFDLKSFKDGMYRLRFILFIICVCYIRSSFGKLGLIGGILEGA